MEVLQLAKQKAVTRQSDTVLEKLSSLNVVEPCALVFKYDGDISPEVIDRIELVMKITVKKLELKRVTIMVLNEGIALETMSIEQIQRRIDQLESHKEVLEG